MVSNSEDGLPVVKPSVGNLGEGKGKDWQRENVEKEGGGERQGRGKGEKKELKSN